MTEIDILMLNTLMAELAGYLHMESVSVSISPPHPNPANNAPCVFVGHPHVVYGRGRTLAQAVADARAVAVAIANQANQSANQETKKNVTKKKTRPRPKPRTTLPADTTPVAAHTGRSKA